MEPCKVAATQVDVRHLDVERNLETHLRVIAETAEVAGTVRTLTRETSRFLPELLQKTARGIAEAHGCRFDCSYLKGYGSRLN